jgi:hypothetical protein
VGRGQIQNEICWGDCKNSDKKSNPEKATVIGSEWATAEWSSTDSGHFYMWHSKRRKGKKQLHSSKNIKILKAPARWILLQP